MKNERWQTANFAPVLATLARDRLTADLTSGAPNIPIHHLVLAYPVLFVSPEHLKVDAGALKEKVAFISEPARNWFDASYMPAGENVFKAMKSSERRLSPLLAGLQGLPPTTLVSAGLDILRHENRFVAQELSKAGVPSAYRLYEKVPHGFFTFSFLPEAKAAFDDVAKDLEHVLTPGVHFGEVAP